MAVKARPFQCVYVGLWLIRTWFAFYGTGYIHPDENMQNGEIMAGNVLGFHALTTWEWCPDFPVRSVLPVLMTTGLPLLGLRLLFGPERVPPSLVFRSQRLAFLCLSGVLDYGVSNLVSHPASRRLCLLLLASSYVTCTFQVRPFSNSLESVLVTLCLVLFRRVLDERTRLMVGRQNTDGQGFDPYKLRRNFHLLAVLAVIGIFTRPTFVAFTLPIAYQLLWLSNEVAGSPFQVVGLLLPPLFTAMATASVFIAADTIYFLGDFSELIVTPYNFVKYNLSAKNLAEHGLHPNWLHAGVNLPMLLGPVFLWFIYCNIREHVQFSQRPIQRVHAESRELRQTLIQMVVLSLLVLSLQPHQEPRFLTPLILPIVILVATTRLSPPGRSFWVIWITFNAALAVVFGVLHQGGVVPSLFSLHSILKRSDSLSSTHVVYWKTYMPPRHLLGVSQRDVTSGAVSFADLSGGSQSELMAAFTAPFFNATYLVTPVPMYLTLPLNVSSCLGLQQRIFPHLDLDHVPESIQSGIYDALSLGVFTVEWSCVTGTLAAREPL